MVDKVKAILDRDISVVLKSGDLSLSLLKCYSILYLGGGQPRTCEKQQRKYYSQLQKDGIMKAELQKEIDNRTCKPIFKGLKYLPMPYCKHISAATLTDKDAVDLLKKKILKESDFAKLPTG